MKRTPNGRTSGETSGRERRPNTREWISRLVLWGKGARAPESLEGEDEAAVAPTKASTPRRQEGDFDIDIEDRVEVATGKACAKPGRLARLWVEKQKSSHDPFHQTGMARPTPGRGREARPRKCGARRGASERDGVGQTTLSGYEESEA